MEIHTYVPEGPLSHCVAMFWFMKGSKPAHSKELSLPDGSVELVINLVEDKIDMYERLSKDTFQTFPSAIICGPHTEYFVIDTSANVAVIGIHFKPGGAYPFLGVSLNKLLNTHIALEKLWGSKVHELRNALLLTTSHHDKFMLLESFLLGQAAHPLLRHPAIEYALIAFQKPDYSGKLFDLVKLLNISQRRFIEIFKIEVGMSPKLFCRILRFQAVLVLIERGAQIDWSDVAIACGYYDQAHFIKDFQAFSNLNPTEYQATTGRHHNHVPLAP